MHRILVEQSPNAVALVDTKLNILITTARWNTDYAEGTGSCAGKLLSDLFALPDFILHQLHECIADNKAGSFEEFELQGAQGKKYWIRGHFVPWQHDNGDTGGLIVFMTNCTAERTLRNQLKIEKEQFRGAFETSAIGMAIVALDGRWLHINKSLLQLLGYTREEMLQLTFQDITHPEDLQKDLDLVRQLLDGKENAYQMEKRYSHKQSHIVWVVLSVSIVRDTNGEPLHFVSQVVDITQMKKLEQERLRETDGMQQRLANDLHENIAQRIAALKWMVQSAVIETKGEKAMQITSELSDLIAEVKRLSEAIIPTTFLNDAIYFHLETLLLGRSAKQSMPIKIILDERLKFISLKKAYHFYRIIEDYIRVSERTGCNMMSVNIHLNQVLTVEIVYENNGYQAHSISNDLVWNDISTRLDILQGSVTSTLAPEGVVRLVIPGVRREW